LRIAWKSSAPSSLISISMIIVLIKRVERR
jgi:hypothetical protein